MRKVQMKRNIHQIIGYLLLIVYAVVSVYVVVSCTKWNMVPTKYVVIAALMMVIVLIILFFMHRNLITSIVASIITVVIVLVMLYGIKIWNTTTETIEQLSTEEIASDVVSVYVLKEDQALTIEDAKEYAFGMVSSIDTENTEQTIYKLEEQLGVILNLTTYEDMFQMIDDLKNQKIQAIVLNTAYTTIIGDEEEYEWVLNDLRELTSMRYENETEYVAEVPETIPETFIMYMSGIDTYGGVTERSRSDVNILAVVNRTTKNILLLSTPRDFYVSFDATNGAKDKLTHAGIYGVNSSMNALETLYDIDVDYYLRVNFSGFMEIIDALGGVDVYSDYNFTVEPIKTYQKGMNHLTGIEALAFARERYSFSNGDYQRAKHQMEVIRAVIDKCATSSMLKNYHSVMNAVAGSIDTNMPEDQIAALIRMQLTDMAKWNVESYTTTGTGTRAQTYSMPGRSLSVIVPDENSVNKAKTMIQEIYDK